MKKPIYYLDTSVFGGYFDKEFFNVTQEFWATIKKYSIGIYVSELVIQEIQGAPVYVRKLIEDIKDHYTVVPVNNEIINLADKYVHAKVVTAQYRDDAIHVAKATISLVDALISWNFRHLVNIHREEGFSSTW